MSSLRTERKATARQRIDRGERGCLDLLFTICVGLISTSYAWAAHPQKAAPQELDFGKGNAVPLSALNTGVLAPISFDNAKQLEIRLDAGGTVIVSESDLVLGPPDYHKRGQVFMALDVLELKKGSRIVTGGNDLVIFANKISSEDGEILAFADNTAKAKSAITPGGPGDPGVSGGTVTLLTVNGVEGRLHVNLSGQNGGDGLKGSPGATGLDGAPGENPSWFALNCQHDGGHGANGQLGGIGATGGPAGNGGHGGTFQLFNVGTQPVPQANWDFKASAGQPGIPGIGGDGGPGGQGGLGGQGGGPCHGGGKGDPGGQGPTGPSGAPGQAGADGHALVKNMSLKVWVSTAKQELPLAH